MGGILGKLRKRAQKNKESFNRVGISKCWHVDKRRNNQRYLRYQVNYTIEGYQCVKVFQVGAEGSFTNTKEKETRERAIEFREAYERGEKPWLLSEDNQ